MNTKETLWWHAAVTALVALCVLPIALLNQDAWAPFDKVRAATATIDKGVFTAIYQMTVHRRYKVQFTRRLIHMESGINTLPTLHQPETARLGDFPLTIKVEMPLNAPRGTWCLQIEAVIHYNALLNAATRSYEPVCAENPAPYGPP